MALTRENAIEYWDIIVALKEGKQIQWYDNNNQKWLNVDALVFRSEDKYRIKPATKIVPLTTDDLPNEPIIVKDNESKRKVVIIGFTFDKTRIIINYYENDETQYVLCDFNELRDNFTRLDGSRFEKEVEIEE